MTLYFLDNQIDYTDPAVLKEVLPRIQLSFEFNQATGTSDMYLNGTNVEKEIRTMRVSGQVSKVADVPELRKYLVQIQQEMGRNGAVVMEGRDIGSVVFPKAELKVFMTTDVQVRAQRRQLQLAEKGETASIEDIVANIEARDALDSQRTDVLFEKFADEVHELDTTELSIDEQVNKVLERAKHKIKE